MDKVMIAAASVKLKEFRGEIASIRYPVASLQFPVSRLAETAEWKLVADD
jgi:hypothetical protein